MQIVITLFLILIVTQNALANKSEIARLLNIITNGQATAESFVLPTDAKAYQVSTPEGKHSNVKVQDYGYYDFIIVGGGTSGSILASRLSEISDWDILLIEPGNFSNDRNDFIQFPKYYKTYTYSQYNWGYKTVPQSHGCLGNVRDRCPIWSGKGVGGSTLISPVIYDRGAPEVYNFWSKITFDCSWSYKKILKYFKRLEKFHSVKPHVSVNPRFHGTSGLLDVQHKLPEFGEYDRWLAANNELGYNQMDYNEPDPEGASILQHFFKKGVGSREDFGTVFIKPFLSRENLNVMTGSYVTKIEIDRLTRRAQSVIFTNKGQIFRAKANKEIILSAGAVVSPKILMLSGVGPCEQLETFGISCVENLPVGNNLRSTISLDLVFNVRSETGEDLIDIRRDNIINIKQDDIDIRLDDITDINREDLIDRRQNGGSETFALRNQWLPDYVNNGTGELTASSSSQVVGTYYIEGSDYGTSCNENNFPSVQILSDTPTKIPLLAKYSLLKQDLLKAVRSETPEAVSFTIKNINPKSTGTLKLRSNDSFEYPLIDPNVLSNQEDIEVIYKGIQLVLDLINTSVLKNHSYVLKETKIQPCVQYEFKTVDYWYCFIRHMAVTSYGPTGTCPMGSSRGKGAVVDSKLRVFGVDRLRVADASIFPTNPSGWTSIPTAMVGEKLSDELIKYYLYADNEEVDIKLL